MNRREFFVTASATAIVASAMPQIAGARETGDIDGLAAMLRDPPASVRPQIRWWWPGGTIDPAQVRVEARQIADAGFGGFEIADVRDSVAPKVDPGTLGWGSPAWNRGVETALEEALRLGITPSLTLGPHWPTGVPGIVPDDDAASKELVYGMAELDGGKRFKGAVPSPAQEKPSGVLAVQNEDPPVTPVLLAIQAYRRVGQDEGVTVLDPDSRIDLTRRVRDGSLNWRAPRTGEWVLLSFWMRGTGQVQNLFGMNRTTSMLADPTPYVLDIYGPAAVEALTGYWEDNLLSPRIRELMRQSGGTFFEDSLELSFAFPWTPTAIEQFKARRGYTIEPYLPLLVSRQPSFEEMILGGGRPELFRLEGVDTERVRHDFDSMLSEMYVENRLKGLSQWSEKLGMKFRVQAIGSEINSGLAAANADIPEGDNSNDIHGWRKLAAGRDIGGKTILSDEAATFVGGNAHVATWKDALYMLQRDMVGGANQIVLHGFSYADAPGSSWPGFSAFGRSIGNDWGPRDPQWTMASHATAYLARLQTLLRMGRTQADLAVLGEPLKSQSVLHAGYTFQYPAMELFDWPQMRVEDGRLMPEGPGYRAIVLNGLGAIDMTVAKRLEAHVAAGLPVVIVGDAPKHDRGWAEHGKRDAEIAAIFERMQQSDRVRTVARQGDAVGALAALGIASRIALSKPDRILALHRTGGQGDLFYLLNDGPTASAQEIAFASDGIAHRVDLWTGAITRIPASRSEGKTTVRIDLAPSEPAAILISQVPVNGAVAAPVAPRTQSKELGPWRVEFEKWHPAQDGSGHTINSETRTLDSLAPWRELAGLEGMAGVARYRTSLKVSKLSQAMQIDFGKIAGAATVSVNGSRPAPIDPFTTRATVGHLLRKGTNEIVVEVASPLNNLLLSEGVENEGFKPPISNDPPPPPPPEADKPEDADLIDGPGGGMGMQPGAAPPGGDRTYRDYGLIGPVRLVV